MSVGILTLDIYLPESHSLKEKRRCIKPIITRLQKEFNISVVEHDHHDVWQSSRLLIACAAANGTQAEKQLAKVIRFYENHWPDQPLIDEKIEILVL